MKNILLQEGNRSLLENQNISKWVKLKKSLANVHRYIFSLKNVKLSGAKVLGGNTIKQNTGTYKFLLHEARKTSFDNW